MKILVPRPDDPELAKQWDEAKRAVEAKDERARLRARHTCIRDLSSRGCHACNTGTPYPAMTLEDFTPPPDPDCCVGDRSRCRCAPERGGWTDEDTEREKWLAVWAGDQ